MDMRKRGVMLFQVRSVSGATPKMPGMMTDENGAWTIEVRDLEHLIELVNACDHGVIIDPHVQPASMQVYDDYLE